MWESVFLIDVRILLHSQIQANREMQKVWKGFVDRLPLLLPERPAATVCERIDAYTAECGSLAKQLPVTNIRSAFIVSRPHLQAVDKQRGKLSREAFEAAVGLCRGQYCDLL